MDKCEKRRGKYVSAHANSLIAKYRNAGDNEIDNCRKCRQGNDVSPTHERNERRQSNPPNDPAASYYCPAESYRPRKHHGMSSASRTKYLVPPAPEESYRADNKNHGALRTLRNNLYSNNVAIVRKNRYKDDPDEEEESKYVDEDLELTGDDDAEEETREDVADENCENASEFNDKDYDEEEEADYEVDEEPDALERQVDRLRMQRKTRTEPPLRGRQRISAAEPSQHHRGRKNTPSKAPERFSRAPADRDTGDVPTEEEEEEQEIREPEPVPPRKTAWRCPASRQDRETWNQSRNLMERYANMNRASLGSTALQTRRPRTTRPEVETSVRSAQLETVRNRKCSRCAASSGHPPKTASSRNATCRLQDSRYFIREPNGDEGGSFEDPEASMIYHTKQRKSKESKSPIYDPREEARTIDAEFGSIYKSCRSKNSRELPNGYRERTKHSVRAGNRHDPSSAALKHENRYWAQ